MDTIYFDNSATTRVYPEVRDIMDRLFTEDFGNPSSMHMMGVEAERYIKEATAIISSSIGASPDEIFYTSGGTESNNWAVIGAAGAMKRRGMHIITSSIEHPSVTEPFRYLEKEGFEVTYLPLGADGNINTGALKDSIREDTVLVSVIMVNNETGIVTPWKEIGDIVRSAGHKIIYHGDAVQAYGKYRLEPKKYHMDLMSVSGHKIHGPKGVGFLYKNRDTRILPLIYGGGQQGGMRSGTDNVPGIAGIGKAAEICYENLDENRRVLFGLKDRLISALETLEDVKIHSKKGEESAPHIVNASFLGVGSEVLLHSLEEKGIYVSAGSACSTHKKSKSPTLTALGADKRELDSALRFSFCESNTAEEIDTAVGALSELLGTLRKYRSY